MRWDYPLLDISPVFPGLGDIIIIIIIILSLFSIGEKHLAKIKTQPPPPSILPNKHFSL